VLILEGFAPFSLSPKFGANLADNLGQSIQIDIKKLIFWIIYFIQGYILDSIYIYIYIYIYIKEKKVGLDRWNGGDFQVVQVTDILTAFKKKKKISENTTATKFTLPLSTARSSRTKYH
jgi:hypothetical protein